MRSRSRLLDPGMKDVSAASRLLKPYDARLMRCYPVSNRVNNVENDDEGCCRPVDYRGCGTIAKTAKQRFISDLPPKLVAQASPIRN
jgi:hypothetical protein